MCYTYVFMCEHAGMCVGREVVGVISQESSALCFEICFPLVCSL